MPENAIARFEGLVSGEMPTTPAAVPAAPVVESAPVAAAPAETPKVEAPKVPTVRA